MNKNGFKTNRKNCLKNKKNNKSSFLCSSTTKLSSYSYNSNSFYNNWPTTSKPLRIDPSAPASRFRISLWSLLRDHVQYLRPVRRPRGQLRGRRRGRPLGRQWKVRRSHHLKVRLNGIKFKLKTFSIKFLGLTSLIWYVCRDSKRLWSI